MFCCPRVPPFRETFLQLAAGQDLDNHSGRARAGGLIEMRLCLEASVIKRNFNGVLFEPQTAIKALH
jgi:hypothetical protein